MARETEYARQVMEQLGEMFPGKRILSIKEVMQFTGKSRNWVNKYIPMNDNHISTIKLANYMG